MQRRILGIHRPGLMPKSITDFFPTPRIHELLSAMFHSTIRCHRVAIERAVVRHGDVEDAIVATEELHAVFDLGICAPVALDTTIDDVGTHAEARRPAHRHI